MTWLVHSWAVINVEGSYESEAFQIYDQTRTGSIGQNVWNAIRIQGAKNDWEEVFPSAPCPLSLSEQKIVARQQQPLAPVASL